MRNSIIRYLNELPSDFSTNELAFYSLTNRFELHLRDKLAYRLQMQLHKFQILREWNNIDISIHRNGEIRSLIEIKYSPVAYLLRRREKEKAGVLRGLRKDYNKSQKLKTDWHGIIFFSIPNKIIKEQFSDQVKNFSGLNKYVDFYETKRQWRLNIKDMISTVFPGQEFQIKSNIYNIGAWFDTPVDLLWYLISQK